MADPAGAVERRTVSDFDQVVLSGKPAPSGGLFLMTSPLTEIIHPRILGLALKRGLPSTGEFRFLAVAGCRISNAMQWPQLRRDHAAR